MFITKNGHDINFTTNMPTLRESFEMEDSHYYSGSLYKWYLFILFWLLALL